MVKVETLPARTIYLDLNHWYSLGAALAGHPDDPQHVVVLTELTRRVEAGELVFPLSSVHYMELAENPRDHMRDEAASAMALLSRFTTMAPISKILDEELALELNRRFGRPAFPIKVSKLGKGVGFAFGHSTRLRLKGGTDVGRRKFEARLGKSIAEWEDEVNAFAEYYLLAGPPKHVWDQIPNYNPYAARKVADDQLASFNVMLNSLRAGGDVASRPLDAICARQYLFDFFDNFTRAIDSAGFTKHRQPFHGKQEMADFLMSLPSRRVVSMMQFHYLKDVSRDWKINDLRDIDALSIAIPYCDIVVADNKACDTATTRAHLDREFNTVILSSLTDLGKYLDA
ncbi:hypothetical protein ACIA5G_23995 [Amycolatopsis sp. NPDC051758]|uniref:hypothetical protein n=1 Tax=Amycolatopsis sp. NPDC051758 TaxID=3363935 RepID=UPI0037B1D614